MSKSISSQIDELYQKKNDKNVLALDFFKGDKNGKHLLSLLQNFQEDEPIYSSIFKLIEKVYQELSPGDIKCILEKNPKIFSEKYLQPEYLDSCILCPPQEIENLLKLKDYLEILKMFAMTHKGYTLRMKDLKK